MIERQPGENTPFETRRESLESVDREKMKIRVLECLQGKKLTARELAMVMTAKGYIPYAERNFTAPRLTELCHEGMVEPIGKKKCKYTGKMVTVYEVRNG